MKPGVDYWDSEHEDNSPIVLKKLFDNPTGRPDWETLPTHVKIYYSLNRSFERVVFFDDDEFRAYEENLKNYFSGIF